MPHAVYLIPAYQPSSQLFEIVARLRALTPDPIVVIDDGSSKDRALVFEKTATVAGVTVVRHAINLGKGAALKTGFNHALVQYPSIAGVVTLDADGQHRAEDAVAIGQKLAPSPRPGSDGPGTLILGCRVFSREHVVPLRSRFGNELTRKVFGALTGVRVSDTQTGLRGISASLMRSMLRTPSLGYDFETDMLVEAVRQGIKIREFPIPTIYLDDNASSHFNPVLDSIRIYFVFIRFALASVMTALIDFLVFAAAQLVTGNILAASIAGRAVAGTFNFLVAKRLVFRSHGRAWPQALRYAALVAFFLFLSSSAISALVRRLGMNVYAAKLLVETSLFVVTFTVQRLLVFPLSESDGAEPATDSNLSTHQNPSSETAPIAGQAADFSGSDP